MIRPSGYKTWTDEALSKELDRIQKMELKPGSQRAAERSRAVRNITAEMDWRATNPVSPRFNPNREIHLEAHIMKFLQGEGWIGKPSQLRALAYLGEELRQRYENECSHAWAGNSDAYKQGTERLERHVAKLAHESGLALFIQGDCRGAALYVRAAGQAITEQSYSTQAKALHYGRG